MFSTSSREAASAYRALDLSEQLDTGLAVLPSHRTTSPQFVTGKPVLGKLPIGFLGGEIPVPGGLGVDLERVDVPVEVAVHGEHEVRVVVHCGVGRQLDVAAVQAADPVQAVGLRVGLDVEVLRQRQTPVDECPIHRP